MADTSCPGLRQSRVRAAVFWLWPRLLPGSRQEVGGAAGVGGVDVPERDAAGFLEEEHRDGGHHTGCREVKGNGDRGVVDSSSLTAMIGASEPATIEVT